ncbi:DUF4183 domain-containing protein [Peribacillus sp. NPDC076916]|uniref:DUF4183 domain-containing protein n=1 Tax=Peribacillus sp. NPDC076916 TaxID=3390608 RepID=UPI003CFD1656
MDNQVTLDPKVSYMKFILNGVLQPNVNYTVEKGELKLNTTKKGTIKLQMFII